MKLPLFDRENLLFERWPRADDGFVTDGAGQTFEEQRVKILFVLKEANGSGQTWDMRDFMNAGGRSATWGNIARWTAAALEGASWDQVADMGSAELRSHYTRAIAFLNLKKAPGEYRAIPREIRDAAISNSMLLKGQIELYQTDLIVAGGTFDPVRHVLGIEETEVQRIGHEDGSVDTYVEHPSCGVIASFWHPNARRGTERMFRDFVRLIECLRNRGILT